MVKQRYSESLLLWPLELLYLALFVEQVMHTASNAHYVNYMQHTYQWHLSTGSVHPTVKKPLITLCEEKHTLDSLLSVRPLYDQSPPSMAKQQTPPVL